MTDSQAVVLGASMGGLLAARVLSEHYDRVILLERDVLPKKAEDRRGVPQGRHVHAVLPRGAQVMDELFPGLIDELVVEGVPLVVLAQDMRFKFGGGELAKSTLDTTVQPQVTRAMLEHVVRARVTALPNVKIVDGCDVVGLVVDDGRISGVRIAHRASGGGTDPAGGETPAMTGADADAGHETTGHETYADVGDGSSAGAEEVVDAGLVVDAMGRGGRTPHWLAEMGYPVPAEERIKIDMGYASCFLRLPSDVLGSDRGVVCGPVPGCAKAMALFACEGNRWHLTVAGLAGDHPPTDHLGMAEFIRPLAPPDVYAIIRDAETIGGVVGYRMPSSVRRRYDLLSSMPDGLLTFADAMCSFNPVYGQGMTVASLEALELRKCLEEGGHDLPRRFFRATAKIVEPAWQLAAGGDLALPEIEGHRPLVTRAINRYIARLQRAGHRDPVVADAFRRVAGYLDPPSALMTPRIVSRVLLARRRP